MAKLNEKYSYASHKRKTFVGVDPAEFADTEIIGAGFYQTAPYTDVFPALPNGATCTLTRCNLDNCNIPAGYVVNGGTNKHIATQNDGEYWLVGKDLKPLAPRDADAFDRCGLSKDPANIPAEPVAEPVTVANDPKVIERQKIEALKADDARLKAILVEKGELSAAVVVDGGELEPIVRVG